MSWFGFLVFWREKTSFVGQKVFGMAGRLGFKGFFGEKELSFASKKHLERVLNHVKAKVKSIKQIYAYQRHPPNP